MIGVTLEELKKVTRTVAPVQKLLVIEEECFEMGNICYRSFIDTGSLRELRSSVIAHRCCMQAMRDKVRYFAELPVSNWKQLLTKFR